LSKQEETMNMKRIIISLFVLIVAASFLLPAATEKSIRVKAAKANVRQAPNISAVVVSQVSAGMVLRVLEQHGNWYKVTLPPAAGKPAVSGYISNSAVELYSEPARETQAAVEKKHSAKPAPAAKKRLSAVAGPKSKKIWLRASYLIGFDGPTANFTGTQPIYHENAVLDVQYKLAKGSLPNLSLGYRFSEALGVELGVSFAKRSLPATIEVHIPHPLQFDHFRTASGSESFSLNQTEVSLGVGYTLWLGKLGVDLTAGPVMVMSKTNLVGEFSVVGDPYPYTTVNVTYNTVNISKSAFGFFAGAGASYYLGSSLGIGAEVRYVNATTTYEPITGQSFKLKLGGLRAGVGVKFLF
jgi:opacity protein-like surface antigen